MKSLEKDLTVSESVSVFSQDHFKSPNHTALKRAKHHPPDPQISYKLTKITSQIKNPTSDSPSLIVTDTIRNALLSNSLLFGSKIEDETTDTNQLSHDMVNIKIMLNKKPINRLCVPDYNLTTMNLSDKETLFYLIERNLSNFLLSPFDQFAYSRLTNTSLDSRMIKVKVFDRYNSSKIKKLASLSCRYDLNDKQYLRCNPLMPSAISSSLSPFFFDIFSIGDLEKLGSDTVQKILSLKRSHTPKKFLDKDQLTENIAQNILWNCIALYKFRISSERTVRMGLFNYYLSYVYVISHLELLSESIKDSSKIVKEINKLKLLLPKLMKALINNGLFKNPDFNRFKEFLSSHKRLELTQGIENAYYKNAIKYVEAEQLSKPLSLSALCRVKVKSSLKTYDYETLELLDLPKPVKKFLMFEDEF